MSVYDKTGLTDLARGLVDLGWELIASGKTAAALADAGIAVTEVAEITGAPEMLGGRVKTLHPKVHGGILADRSNPSHLADLAAQQVEPIDLVVCNLYPFSSDPSIELIDVGGPTMVRAAAKNHAHVGVVVDPADYRRVLDELRAGGSLSNDTRRELARAAFAHTAAYDAAIVAWFDAGGAGGDAELLPPTLHLALERAEELRYGENPHQRGARYRDRGRPTWWDGVVQHGGTALSYLNLFDADAAWRLVSELGARWRGGGGHHQARQPLRGGAGHLHSPTPTGAPSNATRCPRSAASSPSGARARWRWPRPWREGPQADVVVAPSFDPAALEALTARRKATRLLEAPPHTAGTLELRSLGGGFLVQDRDDLATTRSDWQVPTKVAPTDSQWRDIELAWRVCARTSSNAIVVAADGQALGVGRRPAEQGGGGPDRGGQGRGPVPGWRGGQRRLLPVPRRPRRARRGRRGRGRPARWIGPRRRGGGRRRRARHRHGAHRRASLPTLSGLR